ncbi:AbrB/MazE/SpoVT family DNA-binding domain-containing protein [Neisseria dumasiana]|uniref:AbrB family transcriptional regulator n=1 Tax=Neisseria dumasiana TaxID=1931275 RepID=A0ABX3WHT8_9NEIS|nr:AbrB/MazE/SpoVT family DNA-binding domain-containing protein [Neisseria dumasiana]OSI25449.1 AbrB family transcriptional regulator [Neisseria dumasiana]UOO83878.1 AbrB/MazE/SpoVT family DNA-binding domain-containing protein [Neisseria dumasiana]
MATTLKITAKNQVTFKKEYLQHLGIGTGDELEVLKLPGGELRIRAKQNRLKSARDFAGCMENVAGVHLSVEEINEAIADAAAESGIAGLEKNI